MTIKYLCDFCKKEVTEEHYLQLYSELFSDRDKMLIGGYCGNCIEKIKALITQQETDRGKFTLNTDKEK